MIMELLLFLWLEYFKQKAARPFLNLLFLEQIIKLVGDLGKDIRVPEELRQHNQNRPDTWYGASDLWLTSFP